MTDPRVLFVGPGDDLAAAVASHLDATETNAIVAEVGDDPASAAEVGVRLAAAMRRHADRLSRTGVGLALVGSSDAVCGAARAALARVTVPVTGVTDPGLAEAWARGQLAGGPVAVRPVANGRSVVASVALHDYVLDHLAPGRDPIAAELAEATRRRYGGAATMSIGEDQGRLLQLLAQLVGAQTIVEVGTFTGTSALWLARGLAEGGRLICSDVDAAAPEIGRPFWRRAGVEDRIELRIGPAAETLAALGDLIIDLSFVDADKAGYPLYVDELVARTRPGGLVAIDNTLWSGAVVDPADASPDTTALRAFNDALAARDDVDVLPLTVGDGLTLVRRR